MADRKQYNNIDFRSVVTGKNVPNPTTADQIANKAYVDNQIISLIIQQDKKDAVRAVAITNITTATAPNVLDGVTLAVGNRVGLTGQTTPAQNGIYVVTTLGTGANGVWTRSTDADSNAKVTSGLTFDVSEGTLNSGSTWLLTTVDPIVLNTTSLTFVRTNVGTVRKYTTTVTSGASSYTVTHGLNTNFAQYSVCETVSGLYPEGIVITRSSANALVFDFGETTTVNHDIAIQG